MLHCQQRLRSQAADWPAHASAGQGANRYLDSTVNSVLPQIANKGYSMVSTFESPTLCWTQQVLGVYFTSLCLAIASLSSGCDRYQARPAGNQSAADWDDRDSVGLLSENLRSGEHEHRRGEAGGMLTSFGRDAYHAEAIVEQDGSLVLLTFGGDITHMQAVPEQSLIGYARSEGTLPSHAFVLTAQPLPGDLAGTSSRFEGKLPADILDGDFSLTMTGLRMDDSSYTLRFHFANSRSTPMPAPASATQAQSLYLTSGGLYTAADIVANGRTTAAEKYADFTPKHDPNPVAGDWICPITRTKANTDCAWIIGGETYFFCCPPCIDEFLGQAKTTPEQILMPAAFEHAVSK